MVIISAKEREGAEAFLSFESSFSRSVVDVSVIYIYTGRYSTGNGILQKLYAVFENFMRVYLAFLDSM